MPIQIFDLAYSYVLSVARNFMMKIKGSLLTPKTCIVECHCVASNISTQKLFDFQTYGKIFFEKNPKK